MSAPRSKLKSTSIPGLNGEPGREGGAVLPELAIVAPLVVLLLMGCVAVWHSYRDEQRTLEILRDASLRIVHECWALADERQQDEIVRHCVYERVGEVITTGREIAERFEIVISYYRLDGTTVVQGAEESRLSSWKMTDSKLSKYDSTRVEAELLDKLQARNFMFIVELYLERDPIEIALVSAFSTPLSRYRVLTI